MLKKTVTYKDFNGVEQTEDLYFNYSKSELAQKELKETGGLANKLQAVVATNVPGLIIEAFTEILLDAYGVRSEDGKRFIKNAQIREDFQQSAAYDALFMDLVTNAVSAAEFIKGIIPNDLGEEAEKAIADTQLELPSAEEVLPPVVKDPKDMTHEELLAAFRAKNDARK